MNATLERADHSQLLSRVWRFMIPARRHVPTRARGWQRTMEGCEALRTTLLPRQRGLCASMVRGMTLIEIMVVVVILGILATTVSISVRDYLVSGKRNAAKQELAQINSALELFYLENDRYPTAQEGLAILTAKTDKHPDGLLRGGDLNDPWGNPYEYIFPGVHGSFDLISFGGDGAEGGTGNDADITSWEAGE